MSLRDLQKEIFRIVKKRVGEETELVLSTKNISSKERLSVYGKSSYARPHSCLSDDFQVCKIFLGEETFDKLIEAYLVKHPANTHFINECGRYFPQFLQENRAVLEEFPFLYDLALFEWLRVESFFNFYNFKTHKEASLFENKHAIYLNPALIKLKSQWPLHILWDKEEFQDKKDSQIYIWTTEDRRVHANSWSKEELLVLETLLDSKTLEEAIEKVSESMEEVVLQKIFSDLSEKWITPGLFEVIAPPEGR